MSFKDDLEYYDTRWSYWSGRIQTNSLVIQSLDMDELDKGVRRYDEMPWFSLDFFSKAKMFFFDRIGKQRELLCYGSMLCIRDLQSPLDEVRMPLFHKAESFLNYHSKHLGFFTGVLKQAAQTCLAYCCLLSSMEPQTPPSTNRADIFTEGLTMLTQEQGKEQLRNKGHSEVSEEEAMPLELYRGLDTSLSARRRPHDEMDGFINLASIAPQVSRAFLVQYHALMSINNRIVQLEEVDRQIIHQGNVLKEEIQEQKQENNKLKGIVQGQGEILQKHEQENNKLKGIVHSQDEILQKHEEENHKLTEALQETKQELQETKQETKELARQLEEMRKMFSSFMNNGGNNRQGSSLDKSESLPGATPGFFK